MKRIGISQRIDFIEGYNESRDALDTNWAELLWSLRYIPIPLCSGISEPLNYIEELKLDGFILSGGNDLGSVHQRDELEHAVLEYSRTHNLPVLGVCRGMQMLYVYCGGDLVNVQDHIATRHELTGGWVGESGFNEVNSYHNQAINPEVDSDVFRILAKAPDNVVESIRHQSFPWLGIMWHPERERPFSESDLRLIANHLG